MIRRFFRLLGLGVVIASLYCLYYFGIAVFTDMFGTSTRVTVTGPCSAATLWRPVACPAAWRTDTEHHGTLVWAVDAKQGAELYATPLLGNVYVSPPRSRSLYGALSPLTLLCGLILVIGLSAPREATYSRRSRSSHAGHDADD